MMKFIRLLKYGLVIEAIRYRLKRVGVDIEAFYLFQGSLNDELSKASDCRFDHCSTTILTARDMDDVAKCQDWRSADNSRSQLEDGQICLGVKVDNELAAFVWANLKEWKFKRRTYPLKKDEAYLFDMFTLPEFRGKGLAPIALDRCYRKLDAMGIKKFFSVSDFFNTPVIVLHKKIGSIFLRLVIEINLFNKLRWQHHFNIGQKRPYKGSRP
jgi:GNAT superfamily N-acetyltransferase